MKSLTIILILMLLIVITGCEKKIYKAQLERKGDPTLYYLIGENEPFTGSAVEYYSDAPDQLKAKYEYKDGRLNGKTIHWHINGKKSKELTYTDNLEDGLFQQWDEEGNLLRIGNYKPSDLENRYSRKVGEWKYYKNGILYAIENYNESGVFIKDVLYYSSGRDSIIQIFRPIENERFRSNELMSRTRFYPNGKKWIDINYTDDRLEKIASYYNKEERLIMEVILLRKSVRHDWKRATVVQDWAIEIVEDNEFRRELYKD